jgi:hypothetical protein
VLGVLAVGALGGIAASLILLHREVALAIICFLVAPLPIFVRIAQRKFDRSSRSRSSRSRS